MLQLTAAATKAHGREAGRDTTQNTNSPLFGQKAQKPSVAQELVIKAKKGEICASSK
jgi:hypothetical protein